MGKKRIITSEYVSYGHPDKVADQISDALLDAYYKEDANVRTGIETMIKDNIVVLGGEVKSIAHIDVEKVVRDVVDKVNYPENHHLRGDDIKVVNLIGKQSPEISKGVDKDKCNCCDIGAGDQGFVVGMASNETEEYIPLGVYIARHIVQSVCKLEGIGPDVKSQVSVEYGGAKPIVKTIVVSAMHREDIAVEEVIDKITNMIRTNDCNGEDVMNATTHYGFIKGKKIDFHINSNGKWNIGGPISDCGVTGRKIVVDHYGGYCNVGGGAFSGKDMTKVDRSGAYMCRYLAKNIVDAGIADEARVELSYVIGEIYPYNVNVELTNPKKSVIKDLAKECELFINTNVDLSPKGVINRFMKYTTDDFFYHTARYGHFGFDGTGNVQYPWEKLDLSDRLKEFIREVEINLTTD